MRGINRVFLYGNLGRDPKVRTTPGGQLLAELNIATNRATRSGDDWVDTADWHDVEVWGKEAEVAQRFLSKGDAVCVEGQNRNTSWVDKESGQKRYRHFVHCDRLHLVPNQRRVNEPGADAERRPDPEELDPVLPGSPVDARDELPF